MNKKRILKIGLALILTGAAGYYVENGPRFPGTSAVTARGGEALDLLREPQGLPDIDFTDGDGRPTRLSDFRGKVILLNLWATWCPPCRKEMPSLDRLQAILGGPDFEVIALSVDRGLPVIKTFYLQTAVTQLRIYVDQSEQAMPSLAVTAIPTTLLIDRHGREVGRKIGPAEWDSPALIRAIRDHVDAPAKPTALPGGA